MKITIDGKEYEAVKIGMGTPERDCITLYGTVYNLTPINPKHADLMAEFEETIEEITKCVISGFRFTVMVEPSKELHPVYISYDAQAEMIANRDVQRIAIERLQKTLKEKVSSLISKALDV